MTFDSTAKAAKEIVDDNFSNSARIAALEFASCDGNQRRLPIVLTRAQGISGAREAISGSRASTFLTASENALRPIVYEVSNVPIFDESFKRRSSER